MCFDTPLHCAVGMGTPLAYPPCNPLPAGDGHPRPERPAQAGRACRAASSLTHPLHSPSPAQRWHGSGSCWQIPALCALRRRPGNESSHPATPSSAMTRSNDSWPSGGGGGGGQAPDLAQTVLPLHSSFEPLLRRFQPAPYWPLCCAASFPSLSHFAQRSHSCVGVACMPHSLRAPPPALSTHCAGRPGPPSLRAVIFMPLAGPSRPAQPSVNLAL